MRIAGQRSALREYPLNIAAGKDHTDALSNALAASGRLARSAIDQAAKIGDVDTSDLFTDVSRGVDKQLWFVEAHLHGSRFYAGCNRCSSRRQGFSQRAVVQTSRTPTDFSPEPVSDNKAPEPASAWSPLYHPIFRRVWTASFASNIGTWMQNVGAAWLMSSVSSSPMMVALIQSATSFPAFLLSLPAGALADIVDRRRLLLFTQGWMLLAASLRGVLTLAGMSTSWVLLSLTFAIGIGAAMNSAAWQATLPEMVPPRDLRPAVALNAIGANLARAVGPPWQGALSLRWVQASCS